MTNYDNVYGEWAGNPDGRKPDLTRCCEKVFYNHRSHQCKNKRGHGPDGEYCAQHDPVSVAKRRAASDAAYQQKSQEEFVRRLGTALPLIRAIAAGHNDPRTACIKWLEAHSHKLPSAVPPAPPPPPPAKV